MIADWLCGCTRQNLLKEFSEKYANKFLGKKTASTTEDEFTNLLLDFKWLLPLNVTESSWRADSFPVAKQKDKVAYQLARKQKRDTEKTVDKKLGIY